MHESIKASGKFGLPFESASASSPRSGMVSQTFLALLLPWLAELRQNGAFRSPSGKPRVAVVLAGLLPDLEHSSELVPLVDILLDSIASDTNATVGACEMHLLCQHFRRPLPNSLGHVHNSLTQFVLRIIESHLISLAESPSSGGFEPSKTSRRGSDGVGRQQQAVTIFDDGEMMETGPDDSFERVLHRETSSSAATGPPTAEPLAILLNHLAKERKFSSSAFGQLSTLLSKCSPKIAVSLLLLLSSQRGQHDGQYFQRLGDLVQKAISHHSLLQSESLHLGSGEMRGCFLKVFNSIIDAWPRAPGFDAEQYRKFVTWSASYIAFLVEDALLKALRSCDAGGETQALAPLLSLLVSRYSGKFHAAVTAELLSLLTHGALAVRRAAAAGSTAIFETFDDLAPYTDIFDDTADPKSASQEECATSIWTLAHIASAAAQIELRVLADLFAKYSDPPMRRLVSLAVSVVAQRIGQSSPAIWLRRHLGFLALQLTATIQQPIMEVMGKEFFGLEKKDFVLSCLPDLIVYIALSSDGVALVDLKQLTKKTEIELIFESYPTALARLLPHAHNDQSSFKASASRAVAFFESKKWWDSKEGLEKCLSDRVGEVIGNVLSEQLPDSVIRSALSFITTRLKATKRYVKLVSDHRQWHRMLISICQRFAETERESQQSASKGALENIWKAAVEAGMMSSKEIIAPLVFASLRMNQVSLLSEILTNTSEFDSGIQCISRLFQPLLSQLIEKRISRPAAEHENIDFCINFVCQHDKLVGALVKAPLLPRSLSDSLSVSIEVPLPTVRIFRCP